MSNPSSKAKNSKVRTWIILAIVIVVIVAGAVVVLRRRASSTATTQYQTVAASKGTLTATIGATGTVRSNQTTIIMWKTSGTIGSVNVKAGDQVKAGDLLADLLPDANQLGMEANLVTAQENLAQLTSPDAIANADLAVTTAEKDVINAQNAVNNNQYWKNTALIQNYYANYVIAKDSLDRAQKAYDAAHVGDYINNANEAVAYQNLYNAQKVYDNAFYFYSLYSQAPTQRQTDEAKANLALANATLTNAKNYVLALTGGNVPADATGAALYRLNQAKMAVKTAQANLDSANLTAPFDGTITEVDGMAGDQVSPATQAFRLDDLTQLKIDVQVSEVDINNVQVGQPVTITFDAVSGKSYNGKVSDVAQVGNTVQGAVDFTVTVVLTNPDVMVKPGMTAAVTITVKQLNNVLLVPNRAVRLVNNQRVVYILQNGQPQEVSVNLGASSDSSSEVVSGDLKAGDLVILNPPSTLFNRSSGGGGGPFGGG